MSNRLFYTALSVNGVLIPNAVLGVEIESKSSTKFLKSDLIINKSDICQYIKGLGIPFSLSADENLSVPFLIADKVTDMSKVVSQCGTARAINCTSILNNVDKLINQGVPTKDAVIKVVDVLSKKPAAMELFSSKKFMVEICTSYAHLKNYLKGDKFFKIGVPLNMFDVKKLSLVQKLTRDINNKTMDELSFVSSDMNKTLHQNTPEDQLFIEIPDYSILLNDEDYSMLIPNLLDVCNPYPNNQLRTIFWRKYLDGLNPTDVTGSSDNDDLDIQDNEKDYYKALCDFVDYGIKQRYPDKDLEECKKQGAVNKDVQEYLFALLEQALALNWSHTGYIPVRLETEDTSDSDFVSDKDDEDVYGSLAFQSNQGINDDILDGTELFKSILKNITKKNPYCIPEAIIKTLRWGDRKPCKIKIKGMDNYLDMNTFTLTSFGGSIEDVEVIETRGCQFVLNGVIYMNGVFSDGPYVLSRGLRRNQLNIPVGLRLVKRYKNGLIQTVYMSIIDYITEVNKGNDKCTVLGIHKEGNRFIYDNIEVPIDNALKLPIKEHIQLERILNLCANSKDGKDVLYTSDSFKEVFLSYRVRIDTSTLKILEMLKDENDLERVMAMNAFIGKEDFHRKTSEMLLKPSNMLSYTIGDLLLPIEIEVLNDIHTHMIQDPAFEPTFEFILNSYNKAIADKEFEGNYKFLLDDDFEDKPKQSLEDKTKEGIEYMNAFGSSNSNATIPNVFGGSQSKVEQSKVKPTVEQPKQDFIIEEDEEVVSEGASQGLSSALFNEGSLGGDVIIVYDKESELYNKYPETHPFKAKTKSGIVERRALAVMEKKGDVVLMKKLTKDIIDNFSVYKKRVNILGVTPKLISSLGHYCEGKSMEFQFDNMDTLRYIESILFTLVNVHM